MTIRIRLIFALCLLLRLLGIGILTIFRVWILPESETIDQRNRLVDLSRVEQELARLALLLHDWG